MQPVTPSRAAQPAPDNTPEPRDGETALERRIRLRCVECGDCWIWQGATSKSIASRRPVMDHGGRNMSVRRVVAGLLGIELTGKRASNTCADSRCVSPAHFLAMTPSEVHQRNAALTGHQRRPGRNLKQQSAQARKLTLEIAREIRNSPLNQRDAAREFGVSKVTVWSIRTHRTWCEYSSPFTGLMAANDSHRRSSA